MNSAGRYKPYPAYKDSGVEWLGEVPEGWSLKRLKYVTQSKSGKGIISEQIEVNGDYPVYGGNGIRGFFYEYTHDGKYVLIGRQGAQCGNVHYVEGKFWASEHAVVSTPDQGVNARWLYMLLCSMNLNQYSESAAQPGLAVDAIVRIPVPFPSLPEQTAIAAFLDRETAKIDALIAKKQRLIELLQEKRSAVISHAVTKGLSPDAPMKDSGVEWLGEVPEGWTLLTFRAVSNVVRGGSPRPAGDSRYFHGDHTPWITVAEITKDDQIYLRSTASCLTKEGIAFSRLVVSGTLVLTNSGATLGVPKILKISGCCNDGVVAFENLSNEVDIKFAYLYLQMMTDVYRDRIKQGAGQPNLNTNIVKSTPIALPPRDEQKKVIEHIEEKINSIDTLVSANRKALAKLQEYRSALITAAVTGKIDVREEVGEGLQ